MSDLAVPEYLERCYWWAYARPWALRLFDRQISVNLILYGQYDHLRDRALESLGDTLPGKTLQMGCCYGNLTPHIIERVEQGGGHLDVIDIVPMQLQKLERKMSGAPPVGGAPLSLFQMDSAALSIPDESYDRILIFLLLHEQPREWRERTFSEALRVLKPGGRIVIIDYAQYKRWHPVQPYLRTLLSYLKPYVRDVFTHPMDELIPRMRELRWKRDTYFGGLFQRLVAEKSE